MTLPPILGSACPGSGPFGSVLRLIGTGLLLMCPLAASPEPAAVPPGSDTVTHAGAKIPRTTDRNAFFGELHLHTQYSADAMVYGTFIDPDMAYRFARGEPVDTPLGKTIRLALPLDFMAVTDHSEWFGEVAMALDPKHPKYNDPFAVALRESWRSEKAADDLMWNVMFGAEKSGKRIDFAGENGGDAKRAAPGLWQRTVQAAERYNEPGRFTTFVGFEWTATPDGNNLHRNLIFRGTKLPEVPASYFEVRTPEALWDWIDGPGGGTDNVLAIPHNSNLSNGLMFLPIGSDGRPYDAKTATRRRLAEPLVELAQRKGTSESNPTFAPNDEAIGFELMPESYTWSDKPSPPSRYNWAREGLKEGLVQQKRIGVNPFEFGFVGGTDNHSGLGGDVSEKDTIRDIGLAGVSISTNPAVSAGALTGVWAESNTREDLWTSFKRREVYATSGTRIRVRLFGGWAFPVSPSDPRWVEQAYRSGVPMGSHLAPGPPLRRPQFLVWAHQAPDGARLDRIQMVKGWVENGEAKERVADIACGSGRRPGKATGRCPVLPAAVDTAACEHSGGLGATELSVAWQDREFDARAPAFYYVRVLEVPTCRWSTYDAIRRHAPLPTTVSPTIQERAWSSPIWYEPSATR